MHRILLLSLLLTLSAAFAFPADEIALPAPQKIGGPELFVAIDKRGSAAQSAFPATPLDPQDLSTLLWAASGHNRDGAKWTVPMAMGRPPYVKIYVAMADGVYRYDWEGHKLVRAASKNVAPEIALQGFAKNAPTTLYFVGDGEELSTMSHPISTECGILLAGAMSQNVYLACLGVNVQTRLIYSIDRDAAKRELGLGVLDQPFFAMPMGKP